MLLKITELRCNSVIGTNNGTFLSFIFTSAILLGRVAGTAEIPYCFQQYLIVLLALYQRFSTGGPLNVPR